jgi:hypothetical protein
LKISRLSQARTPPSDPIQVMIHCLLSAVRSTDASANVEFRASGGPGPDEDTRDVIVRVSRPYLQFTIADWKINTEVFA